MNVFLYSFLFFLYVSDKKGGLWLLVMRGQCSREYSSSGPKKVYKEGIIIWAVLSNGSVYGLIQFVMLP